MTARLCIAIASILGGLSVAGGAFGAHALKAQLTEKALNEPDAAKAELIGMAAMQLPEGYDVATHFTPSFL